MVTWSPAPTLWPLLIVQTSTVLLVEPQLPTVWPVVTSVTAVNPIVLVAAAGKVIVIWLRPASDIPPPVVEVVKLITYSVRAPAAVDGAVLSTDNPETAAAVTVVNVAEAVLVSALVETVSWLDTDTVVVLVTPSSSMVTWSPAPTLW